MNSIWEILGFLVYIGITTGMTILIKLVAFKRIGSVSIDIAIFATLYCFFNSVPHNEAPYLFEQKVWLYKGIINLLFLFGLIAAHALSYDHLNEKIDDDIEKLKANLGDNYNKKANVDSLRSLIKLTSEVAFKRSKEGKAKRRKRIRKVIKELGFDPGNILIDPQKEDDDEAFMLSQKYSYRYLKVFAVVPTLLIIITITPSKFIEYLTRLT